MIKKIYKSPYFKAMLVFIIGGFMLMLLNNLIRTADAGDLIKKINSALMPLYMTFTMLLKSSGITR